MKIHSMSDRDVLVKTFSLCQQIIQSMLSFWLLSKRVLRYTNFHVSWSLSQRVFDVNQFSYLKH